MYLLDDRYGTLVAFLMGFDAARDGKFLQHFNVWCREKSGRPDSSLHWAPLIYERAACEATTDVESIENIERLAKVLLMNELAQFVNR